jgi:hypothetical protein
MLLGLTVALNPKNLAIEKPARDLVLRVADPTLVKNINQRYVWGWQYGDTLNSGKHPYDTLYQEVIRLLNPHKARFEPWQPDGEVEQDLIERLDFRKVA